VTFGPIDAADRPRLARAVLAMHAAPAEAPSPVPAKRLVTLDPDDPDDVARAWEMFEKVFRISGADPKTRADIFRLLPYLDPETRAEIERLIDEVPPITILREPSLFAALVAANHRGCSSGCMARSGASRAA